MEEKRRRLIYSYSPSMSRMNQLSDDILVLILSKLTMKEAARTSVISHRWENLWVCYAGSLNFYLVDATSRLLRSTTELSIERERFISWVNQILNLHRGPTVDEFRVCFDLDACNGDDIERWIAFAMEKTLSRFELDFSHFGLHVKCGFQFPFKLFDLPNNLSGSFGSLTFLRLNSVDLSDQVVAYFLSNCQSLEHLSIKGASSLTYLNATNALKLKHLEIQRCNRLKKVDISKKIIESLNFYGKWLLSPLLQELHLLREVSMCGGWCTRLVRSRFLQLPVSQLQKLELDMGHSFKAGSIKWAEVFPTLCNLKHLELRLVAGHDQNIFCLTSLICASPLLSSFTLKVRYVEATDLSVLKCLYELPNSPYHELPNCEWRKSEKHTHECLKVVELMGWYGYKSDLDLAQYLMENSVLLEKVTIDPKYFFKWRLSALDKQEEDILKVTTERANSLQKYVQPGMEFVIL